MIDLLKVDYRLTILLPSGIKLDISELILSAIHEEMKGEMAARLKVNIKNIKRGDGWVHQHVFLAKRLVLEATDGNGWKEIFRGSNFSWKTTGEDQTVDFTAYDMLFPLMQSKEHYYFKAGMTGSSSIKQIANEQGILLGNISGPTVSLGKKMYNGLIGDTIAKRLEESKEKDSVGYVVRSTQGKLESVKEGSNSVIYELTGETIESSSDERSIEGNFITRVKIYGNESKKGTRPKIETTLNGNTQFGVIQDILYKSDFKNIAEAKAAAKAIIKEKGNPEINRPLIHPDIPWLRKGDKIKVKFGTIDENCIVESVSRDLATRKMTLRLKGA